MRLRAHQNKLKVEHSIIDGLRPVRDARGAVKVRITVPVQNGWKAIALSAGARQELFISTALTQPALEELIEGGIRGR
jgi:hypothetical protein